MSGPALQPAGQQPAQTTKPVGFSISDSAPISRRPNANAMTQTARSRSKKSAPRRSCALIFGLICFFKEPSLANGGPIVTGGAKNVEIFFLSSFEKARVTTL
jgi:hypothetical protein